MEDRQMSGSIYARAMRERAGAQRAAQPAGLAALSPTTYEVVLDGVRWILVPCTVCEGPGWIYDGQGGPPRYAGDPCPSICGACKGAGTMWRRAHVQG